MASDGSIKITTDLDDSQAKKAMSKFNGLAKTGLKATVAAVAAVSTALLGAGAYAIKTGIAFETAFAGVKKTVDASSSELAEMREGIIDMTKRIPQSASAIAGVAEAAGQLGIKNKNILSFTEVMTNLGVATNMSAEEAATSLARLANITKMPQENFDRLGSVVVHLGNNLATTESEIVEMGLRLAGAGKQVGMTEAQILGMSGALSSVGIAADAGGSAMSTVMSKMQLAVEKGGTSLDNFAKVAGMSANDFKKAFKQDASGAIVAFVEGLGKMQDNGQSAIKTLDDMGVTEIRQRDALLRLSGAGDLLSESIAMGTVAWQQNTALANEAQQKYETLESRMQVLKNNVNALAIAFYDEMRPALKDTVEEGLAYVKQLADAFGSGGLQGMVDAAGDIFADIATKAARQAPRMVDAAIDFIKAFGSGIYRNRNEIYNAAVDIVATLAKGLADLLPKSVRDPIQRAVEEIAKSFKGGGLRSAVEGAANAFKGFVDVLGSIYKVVLPPLVKGIDLVAKNLDILVPLTIASVTAFKGMKVVETVSSWYKKASAASVAYAAAMKIEGTVANANSTAHILLASTMSATELIVGVLTGKVTLSTAAWVIYNKVVNANPMMLAVTAAAALTAGLFALHTILNRTSEEEKKHIAALKDSTKEAEKNLEKAKERKQSYDDLVKTQNEQAAAELIQLNNSRDLVAELENITDSNGKVKKGYEDRAAFITSQLSSALGVEIKMTGNQIDNYQELVEELKTLVQQKRIDAVLTSQQAKYEEAVTKQLEVSKEALANKTAMQKAEKIAKEENIKLAGLEAEMNNAQAVGNDMLAAKIAKKVEKQREAADEANAAYKKNKEAYEKSSQTLESYANDIDLYTSLAQAAASGNGEAIEKAIAQITAGVKTSSSATKKELQDQVIKLAQFERDIKAEVDKGTPGFTQSMLDQAQGATKAALEEFAKAAPQTSAELAKVPPAAVAALIAGKLKGELSKEASGAVDGMLENFKGLDKKTQKDFAQVIYGALEGLEGFEDIKDPAEDGVDAFLKSLEDALEVHSPSRAVKRIFAQVWPGASEGLEEGQEEPMTKGRTFVSGFLGIFTNSQLGKTLKESGSNLMSLFGKGADSKKEDSKKAGVANAESARDGAGSVDPTEKGTLFANLFKRGIDNRRTSARETGIDLAGNSKTGAGTVSPVGTGSTFGERFMSGVKGRFGGARTSGTGLANESKSGAGTVNPNGTGGAFGDSYNSGVSSRRGSAWGAGNGLGNEAKSGAGSVSGYGAGDGFGSGFIRGIGDWLGRAATAGWNLARRAYDAAKRAIDSNSPSKKMRKVGRDFDRGMELGIDDEAQNVADSAADMSTAALDAIDTDGINEKLKGIDIDSTMDKVYDAVSGHNAVISDNITSEMLVKVKADTKDDMTVKLSEGDITMLSEVFAQKAAVIFARSMDGMTIQAYEREFARLVQEAQI